MTCPWCHKKYEIPEEIYRIDEYGESFVRTTCPKCDNQIKVYIRLELEVTDITRSNHKKEENDNLT